MQTNVLSQLCSLFFSCLTLPLRKNLLGLKRKAKNIYLAQTSMNKCFCKNHKCFSHLIHHALLS